MRARDAVIVGAVVVVGGFAAFDAVRGGVGDDAREERPRSVPASTEPVAAEPLPRELPRGVLDGSLVLTEVAPEGPRACRLQIVNLATGEERRLAQDPSGCFLSVPRAGRAVAKSLTDVVGQSGELPYRIIDARYAGRDFPHVYGQDGRLEWSLDGRRVASCPPGAGRGYELELSRGFRALRECADGYTAGGDRFYLKGRRLFVGQRVILERPDPIERAVWSTNETLALVVGGRRLERWDDDRLDGVAVLPQDLAFRPIHFSPDNCAALVIGDGEVHVVDLGCFRGRDSFVTASPDNCIDRRSAVTVRCFRWETPSSFLGNAATWSPDGNWIAVAEEDAVTFHRLVGRYEALRWDVTAAALAWR